MLLAIGAAVENTFRLHNPADFLQCPGNILHIEQYMVGNHSVKGIVLIGKALAILRLKKQIRAVKIT